MSRIKIEVVMCMLFSLLGLLLLSYLNYTVSQERQMFIANRLYSAWSFEVTEEISVDQLTEILPPNFRIFIEHTENGQIRTFYQTGNWKPPMVEGVFFNNEAPTFSAVVGEYHTRNGETMIEIEGYTYDIIGVLGASYPSVLDRLILLNTLPIDMPIVTIIIDGRSSMEMEDIYHKLAVTERHTTNTATDFLGNHALDEVIRRNVLAVTVILSILLGYVYMLLVRKRDEIYYLFGKNKFRILIKNSLEILTLAMIAFISVWILDRLVGHQIMLEHWCLYGKLLVLILVGYQVNFIGRLIIKTGGVILRD